MTEHTIALDNPDAKTADLSLKLRLEDIEDFRACSKDKNRNGVLNIAQMALSLLEENLEGMRSIWSHRQMTQSIANAVQADGEAIANVVSEEEPACEDHALAHRLNETAVASEVHVQPGDLNVKILAKPAGRYMSEDVGYGLFKDARARADCEPDQNYQEEDSVQRSARKQELNETRELQCIALQRGQEVLRRYLGTLWPWLVQTMFASPC
ncbi:uncharacterized protein Z519_00352 [Cladophialophora bantiana CBS 173.52]|uniref:Uncharacterized protein n=1 Tax=Cladophialophora bantiana (strain ATCC 10958 / CBS 173.52 / CDC B-1940 / NIH 8579) TaxID=1442370 RepID=A0A0D2F9C6_CLAB1|nr:uncharacterized protein Z519_00352 [Cladophialophora bantiana CBS 173.52]KIW98691.1 hypothetical protein Z519_00352 [Cladophialophora bantiana CBS 173.52]